MAWSEFFWQRDIPNDRNSGIVRCSCVRIVDTDMEKILSVFGLFPTMSALMEVDAEKAQHILAALLWKDMAYSQENMSLERAEQLAHHFVNTQNTNSARFFSNGDWSAYLRYGNPFEWTGLTDSTFDGGVIAVGRNFAACVWFEDED